MSKAKIFLACLVWLVILSIGAVLYRLVYVPSVAQKDEQKQQEVLDKTSGESKYSHHIKIGLDGFSGYLVLRSSEFNQQLRSVGIKAEPVDDGADYDKRLAALASGELQLAAFPVDALLKASAKSKAMPATIVAIICTPPNKSNNDKIRGADAVVAYSQKFPSVESLNKPETRFVLVNESPSDTLTRVLMHSFLSNVSPKAIVAVENEKELLARYRKATPSGNEVFVTWEPVVSEMLKNDQVKVIFDSSSQSGNIVDALVVSRDYLIKNEQVVRHTLECYFRTLYSLNDDAPGSEPRAKFKDLIRRDAAEAGTTLDSKQVDQLVTAIVWKHTQDNFAHFGLGGSATHIEDIIDRIRRVLIETKGLETDPTQGDSSRLFNQQALREIQSSGFHAGLSPEVVQGEKPLAPLDEKQWSNLANVATLQVPPLVFARGTSTLTGRSEAILEDLSETLESFPAYYLTIAGNASSKGDLEANRELAKQRAAATLEYLQSKGVTQARMRAVSGEVTGEMSVTFRLGQLPY